VSVDYRLSDSHGGSRTTTSLTFRLAQDSVKKLHDEAQKQGISVNSLVNQVINNFFNWHIFEQKVGFVPILKPVVKEIYTSMSKEKVLQLAANIAKEESEAAIYFMRGKIDLDSFLSWFEARMKNSAIQLSHTFDNKTRIHTYVIKHDICENWSLYLKCIVEHIFNEVLQKKVETTASNTTLAFKFKQD
jgi:hypothetical protein